MKLFIQSEILCEERNTGRNAGKYKSMINNRHQRDTSTSKKRNSLHYNAKIINLYTKLLNNRSLIDDLTIDHLIISICRCCTEGHKNQLEQEIGQ